MASRVLQRLACQDLIVILCNKGADHEQKQIQSACVMDFILQMNSIFSTPNWDIVMSNKYNVERAREWQTNEMTTSKCDVHRRILKMGIALKCQGVNP